VARAPSGGDAQFSLASVYARTDRVPERWSILDICLGIDPTTTAPTFCATDSSRYSTRRRRRCLIFRRQSKYSRNRGRLTYFLAMLYEQLGECGEAAEERGRAGVGEGQT